MSKETLKMALEALQIGRDYAEAERLHNVQGFKGYEHCAPDDANAVKQIEEAIKALEKALAKQEQGEPVHQYRSPHCSDWYDGIPDHHDGHGPYEVRTLYTTPQQRKPLTRAQIINAVATAFNFNSRDYDEIIEPVARAIEAAHGITASEAEDSARSKT